MGMTMLEPDEVLALDLMTLRAHTERAGDELNPSRLRDSIVQLLARSEVAAVRRDGRLVAYAMLQPQTADEWFVTGLNTHPEFRNAPVLRTLFMQVAEIARRRAIAVLRSHVYKTNAASLAFHRRLGFHVSRENEKAVEFTAAMASLIAQLPARQPAAAAAPLSSV